MTILRPVFRLRYPSHHGVTTNGPKVCQIMCLAYGYTEGSLDHPMLSIFSLGKSQKFQLGLRYGHFRVVRLNGNLVFLHFFQAYASFESLCGSQMMSQVSDTLTHEYYIQF